MRQAIICTTLTQAFNAVCLKRTVIGDEPTDLVFYTDQPFGDTLLKILMATGDFARVTWAHPVPSTTEPDATGFWGWIHRMKRHYTEDEFRSLRWMQWPWSQYSTVWAGSLTPESMRFIKFIKSQSAGVKVMLFDEGMGSYQPLSPEEKKMIAGVALMRPSLASTTLPTLKMGTLTDPAMASFWAYIEKEAPRLADPMPDVLFVDQWLGMPSVKERDVPYWQNSDFMRAKMTVLMRIDAAVSNQGQTFGVSVHPSSLPLVAQFYRQQGLSVFSQPVGYPIECALALSHHPSTRFVTLYSTGAISPLWTNPEAQAVMIYRFHEWKNYLPESTAAIDVLMASFEQVLGSQLDNVSNMAGLMHWLQRTGPKKRGVGHQ